MSKWYAKCGREITGVNYVRHQVSCDCMEKK